MQWLRAQPHLQDLVRACYYDDPLLDAAARYRASTEWSAVRALLPARPGLALDLGAGRGIASFALAAEGWTTVALEPDGSAVVGAPAIAGLARAARLPITAVRVTGERLPVADRSVDLVFSRAVLHHADLDAVCREVARVLRPGGSFVAIREHVLSREADRPAFLAAHPLHRHFGGENAHVLSRYLDALRGASLEVVRVLNPMESDVNLFPATTADVKAKLSRRLGWPWPAAVPDAALRLAGALDRTPGRLYSFVCRAAR